MLRRQSEADGKRLRMIARLEGDKASIGLQQVDLTNDPFYTLIGDDNMIVFTTERYKGSLLVVRGGTPERKSLLPGCLQEIITIGNLRLS